MRTYFGFIMIAIILIAAITPAFADIPRLINYQGRLTDSLGIPTADGDYTLDFTIFDDSTFGIKKWTESHNVSVENGLFNVQLGITEDLTATLFADHPDLFLAIKISGQPEMEPRTRITAGAFSFHALTIADDAVSRTWDHFITATYYPTSYGFVSTLVSSNEVDQFDNAVPETTSRVNPDGTETTQTMYRVDLRELELKEARLEAELEKTRRQLMEAQMRNEH